MARRAGLPRVSGAEFVQRVLAAGSTGGDAAGGRPASGERPQGTGGAAPDGADGGAASEGAAAPGGTPVETLLVLLDHGTAEDRRLARVLAAAAADHADRVRAMAVPAAELSAQVARWQEERRAFDSYDFRRTPVVGVFRGGRLITTFHPRRVFFAERLQEREEREQLEIFLSKMVYYDPAQVKEQKSLALEAGL